MGKVPHHVYKTRDGVRVPSVTTIIGGNLGWGKDMLMGWSRKLALAGTDPNEVRDKAGRIGTATHKQIEWFELCANDSLLTPPDRDTLMGQVPGLQEDELDGALMGLEKYKDWKAKHEVTVVSTEEALVSEVHKYGGTIDMVAVVDGVESLVDFKTSGHMSAEMRIQVAAYRYLYAEVHGPLLRPLILHLGKPASPWAEYPLPETEVEWKLFLMLREIHETKKHLDPFEFGDTA